MYNTDSNSLNAGAPDIRLSGNQDPNQQMAMSDESNTQLLESLYEEFLGMGFSPADAARKAQEAFDQMSQAPQQNSGIMASAPGTYTQNRKQMMAYGGIAGADGRKKYGIGSFFQEKIMDPIKENPALTAAIVGAGINQFGIPFTQGDVGERMGQNWLGELLGNIPGVQGGTVDTVLGGGGGGQSIMDIFRPETISTNPVGGLDQLAKDIIRSQGGDYLQDLYGITGVIDYDPDADYTLGNPEIAEGATGTLKNFLTKQIQQEAVKKLTGQSNQSGSGITQALSNVASPYLGAEGSRRVNPLYPLGIGAAVGKYVEGLPKDELPMDTTSIDPAAIAAAARGTDAEGAAAGLRFLPEQVTRAAEGGRIGYQGGGLMDMGGMEKDYRNEGGFVALGGKEKADDVPARLSKNEFVFTADAVRGAGGGDIDKGAEIMEDLMNNLEGARGMFANAQKLQNRII